MTSRSSPRRRIILLLWITLANLAIAQSSFELKADSLTAVIPSLSGVARIDALVELARALHHVDPERGLEVANEGLEEAREIGYSRGYIDLLVASGYTLSHLGQMGESLERLLEAVTRAKRNYYLEGEADAYNYIAITFYFLGNNNNALKYHLQSLEIREEIKDSVGLGNSYNNLGLVYYHLGNYEKALEYFNRSAKVKGAVNNIPGLVRSCSNMGLVHFQRGDYEKTLACQYDAIRYADQVNYEGGKAIAFNAIGDVYFAKDELDSAVIFQRKALNIYKRADDYNGMSITLSKLGELWLAKNNSRNALLTLRAALRIAQKAGIRREIIRSSGALAEAYAAAGDYRSAYDAHQLYAAHKDTLDRANSQQIADIQLQYETDRREKEARLERQRGEMELIEKNRQILLIGGAALAAALVATLVAIGYRQKKKSMIYLYSVIDSLTHPFMVINADSHEVELANKAAKKRKKSGSNKCHAFANGLSEPCSKRGIECPLEEVLRTKEPFISEHLQENEDGETKYFEIYGFPFYENGEVRRIIEYHIDVTARKEYEKELALLNSALNAAANAMAIVRRDGVISWVNPAFWALTGFEPDEVIGKTPAILNSGKQDKEFYRRMWNTVLSGESWFGEIVNKRKDGELYNEEMTITPVQDDMGKVTHFITVKQDITSRKEIEKALRRSEQTFRSLANAAKDAIIMLEDGERVVFWNLAAERIFGYTSDEAMGESFFKLVAPPDREEELRAAYEDEEIDSQRIREAVVQDQAGEPIEAEFSLASAAAGDRNRSIVILRDVTDRKEAERALQTAKEQAETANRAKSEFLANMSHELRTPLNGILGYAQILRADPTLSRAQKRGVNVVYQSGEHLLSLINDVLDLSKIEARKTELTETDFNLPEMLSNIAGVMRMRAEQKNVAFMHEPIPPLPQIVYADERKIRQVLLNLLGNSVKFTEQGSVRLQTVAEEIDHERTRLIFTIKDTGVGIAEEKIRDIFLPFRQASDGSAKHEGTGLGLTITKKLLELMDGGIEVSSQLGIGTTFTAQVVVKSFGVENEHGDDVETATLEERMRKTISVKDRAPTIAFPPVETLKEIHENARIGDVRAIERIVKAAAEEFEELREFAEETLKMTEEYSVEEIISFIAPRIEEAENQQT
jgi:PAS domain S-box-containing protein